jgi:hypothetical protein
MLGAQELEPEDTQIHALSLVSPQGPRSPMQEEAQPATQVLEPRDTVRRFMRRLHSQENWEKGRRSDGNWMAV